MQQRIRVNITRPLISTHQFYFLKMSLSRLSSVISFSSLFISVSLHPFSFIPCLSPSVSLCLSPCDIVLLWCCVVVVLCVWVHVVWSWCGVCGVVLLVLVVCVWCAGYVARHAEKKTVE